MVDTLIFDLDGVIIDSEPHYNDLLVRFLKSQYGIQVEHKELNTLAGGSQEHQYKLLAEILAQRNISFNNFDEELSEYSNLHPVDYNTLLIPNIPIVLEWLKKHDFKVGLASSSRLEEIEHILSATHLEHYFEVILSGEMFKESKPNPEIYYESVKLLRTSSEKCLVVEDSEYGINAAKSAGLTCIAIKDNRFDYNQDLADYIVEDPINIIDIIKGDYYAT